MSPHDLFVHRPTAEPNLILDCRNCDFGASLGSHPSPEKIALTAEYALTHGCEGPPPPAGADPLPYGGIAGISRGVEEIISRIPSEWDAVQENRRVALQAAATLLQGGKHNVTDTVAAARRLESYLGAR